MNTDSLQHQLQEIIRFRFLYGRWIRTDQRICHGDRRCSDSSMVDEYPSAIAEILRLKAVQIPLWSMNTGASQRGADPRLGSDSSMVDEYCKTTSLLALPLPGSDSSMVDEYWQISLMLPPTIFVQIPLWSMNTSLAWSCFCRVSSSDSSMVDEYGVYDYEPGCPTWVQIPLWSMNTR